MHYRNSKFTEKVIPDCPAPGHEKVTLTRKHDDGEETTTFTRKMSRQLSFDFYSKKEVVPAVRNAEQSI